MTSSEYYNQNCIDGVRSSTFQNALPSWPVPLLELGTILVGAMDNSVFDISELQDRISLRDFETGCWDLLFNT